MAQRLGRPADDLDALLGEADSLLAQDDDLDALTREADALLAAPRPAPSTPPARRPPPGAAPVASSPRRPATTPRVTGPASPVERLGMGADFDRQIIAEEMARHQPRPAYPTPPKPVPPGDQRPTLMERIVDMPTLPQVLGQAARGFAAGTVGTAANVAGTMAAGAFAKTPEEAQRLTFPAQFAREALAPPPEVQADVLEDPTVLADPRWWGYMSGQLTGSIASLAGTGGVGRAGGQAAAGALASRLPGVAAKLAQWGGPATAAGAEALVEASDVYTTMVQEGQDPAAAAEAAEKVFVGNLALLGVSNHPLFEGAGGQFKKLVTRAVSEGGQETGQQALSNEAQGRPVTEGLGTAALAGALGGPAAGAVLDAAQRPAAPPAPASPAAGPFAAPPVSVPTAGADLRGRLEAAIAASQAARRASSFGATPAAADVPSVDATVRGAIAASQAARRRSSFGATPAAAGAPNADLEVVLAEADEVLAQEPETSAAAPESTRLKGAEPAAPPARSNDEEARRAQYIQTVELTSAPDVEASLRATLEARGVAVPPGATRRQLAELMWEHRSAAPPVDTAAPSVQTSADVPGQQEGDPSAGAEGRPARRRVADLQPAHGRHIGQRARARHLDDVFADILDDARELDPTVDPAEVRAEFDRRIDFFEDVRRDARDVGADPRELLRAIAKLGGIDELEGGQQGELRRLREGQGGAVAGVKGVFRRRAYGENGVPVAGLPLDVMIQHLQQDPRFDHIRDLDDIVDLIDDVQKGRGLVDVGEVLPGYERAMRELGMERGVAWWRNGLLEDEVDLVAVDTPWRLTPEEYERQFLKGKVQLKDTIGQIIPPGQGGYGYHLDQKHRRAVEEAALRGESIPSAVLDAYVPIVLRPDAPPLYGKAERALRDLLRDYVAEQGDAVDTGDDADVSFDPTEFGEIVAEADRVLEEGEPDEFGAAVDADAAIRERGGLRPEVIEQETGLPVDVRGQELDAEGSAPIKVTVDQSWEQYRVGDRVRLEDGSTAQVVAPATSAFSGIQVERDGRRWTVRQEKLSPAETDLETTVAEADAVLAEPDPAIRAELREALGVSESALAAYNPDDAVRKLGRKWYYRTLEGNESQSGYDTRREALEAARQHLELKRDQFNNPEGYRDIESVRASRRIAIAEELQQGGKSELEAYKEAARIDAERQAARKPPASKPAPMRTTKGRELKPGTRRGVMASTGESVFVEPVGPDGKHRILDADGSYSESMSPQMLAHPTVGVRLEAADADTLDTGEQQTRLPGEVGAVRDEERAQPKEDLPEQSLILTAEEAPKTQSALDLGGPPPKPRRGGRRSLREGLDAIRQRGRGGATRTPEFRRWFGASKVVDKNGEPLRVYHGTGASFDTFRVPDKAVGIWLTPDPDRASTYAEIGGRSSQARANVMPVFAAIENPAPYDLMDDLTNKYWSDPARGRRVREELQRRGYDGVLVDGGDAFVAFKPSQIKSAIGNRGTFNPEDENINAMTAWHGSPHVFEKFSLHKIGTGEGAQAYGWGLYFSSERAVAEYYREKLAGLHDATVKGETLPANTFFGAFVRNIAYDVQQGSTWELAKRAALEDLRARLAKADQRDAAEIRHAIDNIVPLSESDVEFGRPKGRLYKVDIPEHDDYLDWDKPLHEQSAKVRAALRDMRIGYDQNYNPARGQDIYRDLWNDADAPVNRGKQARLASERLAGAGIAGIRYLDQGSRSKGAGSYNYVVFDDALVQVEEIHAMPARREQTQQARSSNPPPVPKRRNQGMAESWQRKPGTKTLAETPKNARPSDIVKALEQLFETPVGTGRLIARGALGYFTPRTNAIRVRVMNALPVLAHEFGHAAKRHIGLDLADKRWAGELLRLGAKTSMPSYSKAQVLEEGRAEFFRHWLMEPAEAQAKAPNYYRAFEEALDRVGDLGKGLRKVQGMAQAFLEADPGARVALRIDFDGTGTEPLGDWMDRAATNWIDDLAQLKKAEDAMRGGHPLPAAASAYVLARNARGSKDRAADFLENGIRDADGQFIGPSLRAALSPVKDKLAEFSVYLVALRARELHERNIETGLTNAEVAGTLRDIEAGPDAKRFAQARDAIYAFQAAMLRFAEQGGVLSPQSRRAIHKLNQFYVPFQRVLDGSSGPGTARRIADRISPVKRIKGSGRDIINPLESIIKNAFTIVDTVEKNRAMQALADLVDKASDEKVRGTGPGRWMRRIHDPQKVTGVRLSEALLEAAKKAGQVYMNQRGEQTLPPELEQVLDDLGIDADQVVPVFQTTFTTPKGEQIVTVMRNGTREFYQVEDPLLFQALTQIAPMHNSDNVLDQIATTMSNLLRASATLTIGFIARNPGRDTLTAFLQSKHGFLPVYDTVRGLVKIVLHDLGLRSDNEVALFWSQGVAQGTLVGADRPTIRRKIRQLADPKAHRRTVILNPLELLQAVSAYGEVATRLGEFSLALRQGGQERTIVGRILERHRAPVDRDTLAAATLAARDVTTDFSKAGSVARDINRYAAFFNARVQGYVRIAETLRQRPATVGLNLGVLAAVAVYLKALNDDDDDYRELAEWEKLTYWHFKLVPGQDFFYRIPKPFEWAFVPNLAEAAYDWARDHGDPQAFALIKAQARDNARTFFTGFLPTAVVPVLEASMNYSLFRQRNIVNPWDEDLPLELQASDWTSQTARALTRYGVPLAPAKIDHILYGYTAGMGRAFVGTVADPALRAAGLAPPKATEPEPRLEERPGLSPFVRSAGPRSDAVSLLEFYETFHEMEGANTGYNRAKGDAGLQGRILASVERKRWRGRETEMKAAKKKLDAIADEIDKVYADATMSPWAKRNALEGMRRAMVYEARVGLGYEDTSHIRRSAR